MWQTGDAGGQTAVHVRIQNVDVRYPYAEAAGVRCFTIDDLYLSNDLLLSLKI